MRFIKIFSGLTIGCVLLFAICFAAEGSVYEDVLRLHIIANSDCEQDQNVKLEVRDLVLEKYSSQLSGYTNKNEAQQAAQELLSSIENDVNQYLAGRTDYVATVALAETYFPTKTYGEYSLPCGNYTALCIRLGKAEGKNFWCVMFPPLCLGVSSEEDAEDLFLSCGLNEEEYELMRGKKPVYKMKFKILEILCGAEE